MRATRDMYLKVGSGYVLNEVELRRELARTMRRNRAVSTLAELRLFYERKLRDVVAFNPENEKRIQQYMRELPKAAIQQLLKGRAPAALNAVEKTILRRLQTIKIGFSGKEVCEKRQIEVVSIYYSIENEIRLCDSLRTMPAESLILAISHELAHAADFCFAKGVEITDELRRHLQSSEADLFAKCLSEQGEYSRSFAKRDLLDYLKRGHRFVDPILTPALYGALQACGYLRKIESIELQDDPNFNLVRCLTAPYAPGEAGARERPFAEELLKLFSSALPRKSLGTDAIAKANEDMKNSRNEFSPYCSKATVERKADRLGAEIAGEFVKSNEFKRTAINKHLLPLIFETMACSPTFPGDAHASGHERLSLIYKNPELRAAVGCREPPAFPAAMSELQCVDALGQYTSPPAPTPIQKWRVPSYGSGRSSN